MKDPADIHGLLSKLLASGLTQKDIAERIGTTQATVSRWCNGADPRGRHRDSLRALAGQVGVIGGMTAPVVGYLDDMELVHLFPDGQTMRRVAMNGGDLISALEVRSPVLGLPVPGWLIFFEDRRPRLRKEHVGSLCLVGIDGHIFLRVPALGRQPGAFDLASEWGPSFLNVLPAERRVWAAFVTAIAPEVPPSAS